MYSLASGTIKPKRLTEQILGKFLLVISPRKKQKDLSQMISMFYVLDFHVKLLVILVKRKDLKMNVEHYLKIF